MKIILSLSILFVPKLAMAQAVMIQCLQNNPAATTFYEVTVSQVPNTEMFALISHSETYNGGMIASSDVGSCYAKRTANPSEVSFLGSSAKTPRSGAGVPCNLEIDITKSINRDFLGNKEYLAKFYGGNASANDTFFQQLSCHWVR